MREFGFKIDGVGVSPRNISISELRKLLEHVEDALYLIHQSQCDADVPFSLSLFDVEPGSACLLFSTSDENAHAVDILNTALNSGDLSRIPYEAVRALRKLKGRVKANNWDYVGFRPTVDSPVLAKISPETSLNFGEWIAGTTDIHGELINVGGVKPTAKIHLQNGDKIVARLSQSHSARKLARDLAPYIYKTVHVRGRATWYLDTNRLRSFVIEEIMPFEDMSAAQAFQELADESNGVWDQVDPQHFVEEIRTDTE